MVIAHDVQDGVVVNSANFANEEVPISWGWIIQDGAAIGWLWDEELGKLVPPPEPEAPPRTLEDVHYEITTHIEELLQEKCKEHNFKSLERVALYLNAPHARHRDPANAIARWASHMYNYIEELANQLTIDEIIHYPMETLKADLPSWNSAKYTSPTPTDSE